MAVEEIKREKDQIIEIKEREIQEQKQKMEEMVAEFGDILKETLSSMGKSIRESNKEDDKISSLLANDEKLKDIVGHNVNLDADQGSKKK